MYFVCKYCGKQFSTGQKLKSHEDVHLNIRYRCHQCNKSYSNDSNLRRHISRDHTANRVDANITTVWSYNGHEYVCGDCRKHFTQDQYWEYMRHIGEHMK